MKNPFEKTDSTAVTIGILAGAAAAGIITFLYLTEKGAQLRGKAKKKLKKIAKEEAAKVVARKTGVPRKAVKALTDHVVK